MNELLDFLSLSDANVRYVVLGSMLLAASSAVVGCFTVLKKRSLIGDAIAHSVLPGICTAFILSGTKNPLYLVLGAGISGWLSVIVLDAITRYSKIKQDTATGLVLSVFFGIGIFMLTIIQNSGNAAQTGLNNFLFGKAASLLFEDVLVFGSIACIILITTLLLYKEFKLITFDPLFARTTGLPVRTLELVLTTLTVLAVVVGIQAVGVVLMAAMLITPAAAALYWTIRLGWMLFLAALFGSFSALTGTYISYLAPAMPTGPWIVVVVSTIALFSFFLAPKKGVLYRLLQQRNIRMKILEENILKLFYHLGESDREFQQARNQRELQEVRYMPRRKLALGLRRLMAQGFMERLKEGNYRLTSAGAAKGRRVVKLHRLWELYLTQYMRIAPDHVHEDAESIEHIITPDLEKRLEEKLNFPEVDPHQTRIPYQ